MPRGGCAACSERPGSSTSITSSAEGRGTAGRCAGRSTSAPRPRGVRARSAAHRARSAARPIAITDRPGPASGSASSPGSPQPAGRAARRGRSDPGRWSSRDDAAARQHPVRPPTTVRRGGNRAPRDRGPRAPVRPWTTRKRQHRAPGRRAPLGMGATLDGLPAAVASGELCGEDLGQESDRGRSAAGGATWRLGAWTPGVGATVDGRPGARQSGASAPRSPGMGATVGNGSVAAIPAAARAGTATGGGAASGEHTTPEPALPMGRPAGADVPGASRSTRLPRRIGRLRPGRHATRPRRRSPPRQKSPGSWHQPNDPIGTPAPANCPARREPAAVEMHTGDSRAPPTGGVAPASATAALGTDGETALARPGAGSPARTEPGTRAQPRGRLPAGS